MSLKALFLKTGGFAREELIVGAVVIGGLSTAGAVMGVPWHDMMRSSQVEAADIYREIESANLKFYQEYGYWPDEVTDGTSTANVRVLMDRTAASSTYVSPRNFRPLIEADTDIVNGEAVVRHRYGSGGVIRTVALNDDTKGYRYVITMDNLKMSEARLLDEAVDGKFDPDHGRLQITYLGKTAVARYLANPTLAAVAESSTAKTTL